MLRGLSYMNINKTTCTPQMTSKIVWLCDKLIKIILSKSRHEKCPR